MLQNSYRNRETSCLLKSLTSLYQLLTMVSTLIVLTFPVVPITATFWPTRKRSKNPEMKNDYEICSFEWN